MFDFFSLSCPFNPSKCCGVREMTGKGGMKVTKDDSQFNKIIGHVIRVFNCFEWKESLHALLSS